MPVTSAPPPAIDNSRVQISASSQNNSMHTSLTGLESHQLSSPASSHPPPSVQHQPQSSLLDTPNTTSLETSTNATSPVVLLDPNILTAIQDLNNTLASVNLET